jgi:hypothetical protein
MYLGRCNVKGKYYGFALSVLAALTSLHAQSVPMTARMRLFSEIIVNGNVVETHTQEGIYYRTSTGSDVRQWLKEDGKAATGEMAWGSLKDERGVNYKVDYQRRTAYALTPMSINPPHSGTRESNALGVDKVEGLNCTLFPAYLLIPGSSPVEIGRNCLTDDNVQLKADTATPLKSGKTVHSVFALYDVHVGAEPDKKAFDIKNFMVYRPDSKK